MLCIYILVPILIAVVAKDKIYSVIRKKPTIYIIKLFVLLFLSFLVRPLVFLIIGIDDMSKKHSTHSKILNLMAIILKDKDYLRV